MDDGISVGRRFVGVDLHLHRSVIPGWMRWAISWGGCGSTTTRPRWCGRSARRAAVALGGDRGDLPLVLGGRRALAAAGFEVHLAHPLGMKALRKRKRVKTDPADAYELANLLRLGSLPEAYISPPELRELRELVRHRRQLVKLATAVKAGIRALLAKHNIRLSATQLESDTATGLLDALALPGTYAQRLASQRRLMLVLADEIAAVEVDLHARLRHHPGDRLAQLNVGDRASRGRPGQPLVVARARHPQHPAGHRDIDPVSGELTDQPEPYFGSTFSRAK